MKTITLTEVVQALEQQADVLRTKKLIYCACHQVWENSPTKLASVALGDLIQELMRVAPTLKQLRLTLDKVVKTLSKQAEYTLIANTIFSQVSQLYPDLQVTPSPKVSESAIAEVAQALEHQENLIRIKKLLFYTCRNTWSNDLKQLEQIRLEDLIQELLSLNPTLEFLTLSLDSAVRTLSRQAEYSLVAKAILSKLDKLYQLYTDYPESTQVLIPSHRSGQTTILTQVNPAPELTEVLNPASQPPACPYEAIAVHLEQSIHIVRLKKLLFYACRSVWPSDQNELDRIGLKDLVQEIHERFSSFTTLQATLDAVVRTLNKPEEYSLIANTLISEVAPLYNPPCESVQTAIQQLPSPQQMVERSAVRASKASHNSAGAIRTKRAYEPFDLRLELMRYTNPLRAKILVFSVMRHKFGFNDHDWLSLKNCELDNLLQEFYASCETFTDVESRLEITASCLDDSEEYMQAAGAISQCLQPFYPAIRTLPPTISSTTNTTKNTQVSANLAVPTSDDATQLSVATAAEDSEQTCQFFSAALVPAESSERSQPDADQTCALPPPPKVIQP